MYFGEGLRKTKALFSLSLSTFFFLWEATEFWPTSHLPPASGFEICSLMACLLVSMKGLLWVCACLLVKNQQALQSKGNHSLKSLPDAKPHSWWWKQTLQLHGPGTQWLSPNPVRVLNMHMCSPPPFLSLPSLPLFSFSTIPCFPQHGSILIWRVKSKPDITQSQLCQEHLNCCYPGIC